MDQDGPPGPPDAGDDEAPAVVSQQEPGEHASWLELFFDLVVVAGIAVLAHLLASEHGARGVALYVIAFVAFWVLWACYTTYADIAGGAADVGAMLGGMAALGVMTASVPELDGAHWRAFAVAFIVGRIAASRQWRPGTVVVDLPIVQTSAGLLPWFVSLWAHGDMRYLLWAVGLALDLYLLLISSPNRLVEGTQQRLDQHRERWEKSVESHARRDEPAPGRRSGGRDRSLLLKVTTVEVDVPHLGERMSLFMLIVLGEALVQVVDGAGEAEWGRPLVAVSVGSFALVVCLWQLAVNHGSAGVALLPSGILPSRFAWLAHLMTTGAVATLSAVLAALVAQPTTTVSAHDRRLMISGVAVFALVAVVVHVVLGVRADGSRRRVWWARAAAVGAPLLTAAAVAAAWPSLSAQRLVWVLAAGLLVSVSAGRRVSREPQPRTRRFGGPST